MKEIRKYDKYPVIFDAFPIDDRQNKHVHAKVLSEFEFDTYIKRAFKWVLFII